MEVTWKAPTASWVKANTDGSVRAGYASCGGIFRDHRCTFLGAFGCNLGEVSVFEAEITGILSAMEYVVAHSWQHLWIECDSSAFVQAFKNIVIISFRLRTVGIMSFIGGFKLFALMSTVKVAVVPIS